MILMTFAITIAFLIRSSSLIGWIPLALASIFSSNSINSILLNFTAICKAGLFVAVPLIMISIGVDSLFYGKLTFPQYNFVYINVV
jgi:Alg9-like mannosyltransferase family